MGAPGGQRGVSLGRVEWGQGSAMSSEARCQWVLLGASEGVSLGRVGWVQGSAMSSKARGE